MVRSILVGLNGSTFSTSAVELGVRWAKKYDALLVGLGVVDEATIRGPEMVPLGAGAFKKHRDEALVTAAHREARLALDRFAERCVSAGVAFKLLEDIGLPAERILLEAQRYDLIVMGKQSTSSAANQEQPDATLTHILKGSPRPVVAVPERLGDGGSIVVAYDGSLQAARTLQAFQSFGFDRSQEIHLIAVHSEPGEAARRADRAREFLSFHDVPAQIHAFASAEAPAATIVEQARRLHAELLVMGAYGQAAIKEFFFGSVTRTVLREATVPLFLYH